MMNYHGGQLKKEGLIDLSVNIPQIKFEDELKSLIYDSIEEMMKYPEIDGITARGSIGEALGLSESEIVLGNGATDLIYLIARALKFESAVILQPTFTEYERALKQNQTEIEHVATFMERDLNMMHVSEAVLKTARLRFGRMAEAVYFCNPNNPTGHFIHADEIEKFIALFPENEVPTLVIDESFVEFKNRPDHHEKMKVLTQKYPIIIIRSMTKTYRVPGIRIGYLFGSKFLIEKINKLREPWALNHFALRMIPYFMKQSAFRSDLEKWVITESTWVEEQLKGINGVNVFSAEANFVLIKLDYDVDICEKIYRDLIDQDVHFRKCLDFRGLDASYYRIAISTREENQKMINAFRSVLKAYIKSVK